MSYILDALRKSERERQRGKLPEPLTVQDTLTPSRSRSRWPYFLAAGLCVNAVVLAIFLKSSEVVSIKGPNVKAGHQTSEQATSLPTPADAPRPEVTQTARSAPTAVGRAPVDEKDVITVATPQRVEPAKVEKQRGPGAESDRDDRSIKRREDRTEADAGASNLGPNRQAGDARDRILQPQAAAVRPSASRLYTISELPPSAKEGLPHLALSLHYYESNRAARLVSVSNRTLREGEELSTGLRLEEITPDGAIFSHKGYRFRVDLPQDN